ncbi:penicillin-binding protein 2 [Candidatus Berkelbacteria bacterium]|nr:penicillin-binding protein 2 [Candidatus Berkelbacteria bacterium]
MNSIFEPGNQLGKLPEPAHEFDWSEGLEGSGLEKERERPNLTGSFLGVALLMIILIGRLLTLQVTQGASHQLLAEGNRIRSREIQPPRGVILDRTGKVLAKNVAAFALELTPADLPHAQIDRDQVYTQAAQVTDFSAEELRERVEKEGLRSLTPIILREGVEHTDAILLKVMLKDTPGLRVVDRARREYARAPGLSHILGYTGKITESELNTHPDSSMNSLTGQAGIEREYEALLKGKRGAEQVEVDSRGYFQRIVGAQEPVSGDTLVLTLDLPLQQKLGEILEKKISEVQSDSGAALALDPRDGSIRALVSLPDYDNNEFSLGLTAERYQELTENPLKIFSNRAIGGVYPSGSVIKPVIAAGGLADGVITETTTINAPGEITIGEFKFPDWKVHGWTDVKKAIAVSSNVFFYAVGGGWEQIRGLGIERLDYYLKLFGFGKKTGVDLPGEAAGLVPTPEWKQEVKGEKWFLGDTYHLAIGQGDLIVTPIQLATAISAIANGGTQITPHLLWKDQPTDGRGGLAPPGARVEGMLSDTTLRIVRAGMREAVLSGSARRLQSLPVSSAAKTGTAQFGAEDKTHAWFTAFAPSETPELVVVILIDGGGAGNEVALPVAEEVLKWHFSRPSEERR